MIKLYKEQISNFPGIRDMGGVRKVNVTIKGNRRDPCGDGNVLILLDCINVNILIVILDYK